MELAKKIPFVVILILLGIVVCIGLYTVLPQFFSETWEIGAIIFCVAVIGSVLFWLLLNKEVKVQLLKEYKYLFHNAAPAWIMGLILASLISGLILFSFGRMHYNNSEINPSAFDIVSIYVGSILGVLAIRAFYMQLHPIYEELRLIREITTDLKSANPGDVIWFSFPGLNLCEYRVRSHPNKLGLDDFINYQSALLNKIINENWEFHGICFDKENIDKLFEKYGDINKNGTASSASDEAIIKCKETAKQFIDSINSAKEHNKKSYIHIMLPEKPIEAFVIIGDIVYTIQAWGLPIFKNGSFEDPFKGKPSDKKLVDLIAYRLHDRELAKSIIERAETIVAT